MLLQEPSWLFLINIGLWCTQQQTLGTYRNIETLVLLMFLTFKVYNSVSLFEIPSLFAFLRRDYTDLLFSVA